MRSQDYHIHAQIFQEHVDSEMFIRSAIEKNMDEICITDHMPFSYSSAADRIPTGRVKEYCSRVRDLARKYEDRITIKCGIELDYHPTVVDEIEAVLDAGDFDLLLGSTHLHAFWKTMNLSRYTQSDYVKAMMENTILAAASGYFHVIPHIDMYKWIFSNPQRFPLIDDGFKESKFSSLYETTLSVIRDHGLMLEINPHFAQAVDDIESTYPSPYLAQKALDMGLKFCYGSDAHKAEDVGAMREQLLRHPVYGLALRKEKHENVSTDL